MSLKTLQDHLTIKLDGYQYITEMALTALVKAALDNSSLNDEPFYGKTEEARLYTCRGRAKKGTTRFIRIASASVIWRGLRLTLALTYVLPEYSTRYTFTDGTEADMAVVATLPHGKGGQL